MKQHTTKLLSHLFSSLFVYVPLTIVIFLTLACSKTDHKITACLKENNPHACMMKLAKNNNIQAQYQLALMYEKGEYVMKNETKAIYWYNRSANHGYKKAKHNLEALNKRIKANALKLIN